MRLLEESGGTCTLTLTAVTELPLNFTSAARHEVGALIAGPYEVPGRPGQRLVTLRMTRGGCEAEARLAALERADAAALVASRHAPPGDLQQKLLHAGVHSTYNHLGFVWAANAEGGGGGRLLVRCLDTPTLPEPRVLVPAASQKLGLVSADTINRRVPGAAATAAAAAAGTSGGGGAQSATLPAAGSVAAGAARAGQQMLPASSSPPGAAGIPGGQELQRVAGSSSPRPQPAAARVPEPATAGGAGGDERSAAAAARAAAATAAAAAAAAAAGSPACGDVNLARLGRSSADAGHTSVDAARMMWYDARLILQGCKAVHAPAGHAAVLELPGVRECVQGCQYFAGFCVEGNPSTGCLFGVRLVPGDVERFILPVNYLGASVQSVLQRVYGSLM